MKRRLLFLTFIALSCTTISYSVERFPNPDFQSDYSMPALQQPVPRNDMLEYADVLVLTLAISMATYIIIKARTRGGLLLLSIAAVLYFGVYRKGCVCSIGSIQNIAYALFNNDYIIPLSIILFFAIPIVSTLLFGRAFCASVCPFGCVQDLVHVKTVKLPQWLAYTLGTIPYLYLSLSILFAATGSTFLICRFDPFINIFRLDGDFNMIVYGIAFLLTSVFIARPYCRFLCPYGAILQWASYFSFKNIEVARGDCINCGVCDGSCRYQAIKTPVPETPFSNRKTIRRRLALVIALCPVIIATGGFVGHLLSVPLSRVNPKIALADQLTSESAKAQPPSLEVEKFKSTGTPEDTLFEEVKTIKNTFGFGGIVFGIFSGIVFSFFLVRLFLKRRLDRHEPDRLLCYSCVRCIECCPKERKNESGR